MPNRMYVGNIPFTFTSEDLSRLFSEYGRVVYSQIVQDRETGRSRGFGFVEMESTDMFRAALEQANGREIDGRSISVSEAREREARPGGPGGPGRPRPSGDRPYAGGGGGGRPASGGGGGGRPAPGGGGGGRDWGERPSGGGRGAERGGRDSDRGGRPTERGKGTWRRDDEGSGRPRGRERDDGERGGRRGRFEGLPDDA